MLDRRYQLFIYQQMKGRVLTPDEYRAVSDLAEGDKQVFFAISRRQMFRRISALGELSRLRSLDRHPIANVQEVNWTKKQVGFEVFLWGGFLMVNPDNNPSLTDYQIGLGLIATVDKRSATILALYHSQEVVDLNYQGNLSALSHLVSSFLGYNDRG